MALGGLHDHLQGGFFRYCVDSQWEIPHFEKMLYDQALLLWVYSAAYHIFKKEEYKTIAHKIITCLKDSFFIDGMYASGLDADIDHHEGLTYIWDESELKSILTKEEFLKFSECYLVSSEGNFEGMNHLVKQKNDSLKNIEEKLLIERKKRSQPFRDSKILTSWNCLVGIGLIMAGRYTNHPQAKQLALDLFSQLTLKHIDSLKVMHSSFNGIIQHESYLEDAASILLFSTFIVEETGKPIDVMEQLITCVKLFQNHDGWIESDIADFRQIIASSFDNPTPSSPALAELGILRADILLKKEWKQVPFRHPHYHDFYNLIPLYANGFTHLVHSNKVLPWVNVPFNSIQIKDTLIQNCFMGSCALFKTIDELDDSLKKFI